MGACEVGPSVGERRRCAAGGGLCPARVLLEFGQVKTSAFACPRCAPGGEAVSCNASPSEVDREGMAPIHPELDLPHALALAASLPGRLPSRAVRLTRRAWLAAAIAALGRSDSAALADLLALELGPAVVDGVTALAAVVEHAGAWRDDSRWRTDLLLGLERTIMAGFHASAVLTAAGAERVHSGERIYVRARALHDASQGDLGRVVAVALGRALRGLVGPVLALVGSLEHPHPVEVDVAGGAVVDALEHTTAAALALCCVREHECGHLPCRPGMPGDASTSHPLATTK